MKILITGAAGFIGSNLSNKLINDGHEVWGVDNLLTGKKTNIGHLMDNPRFHFIYSDITKEKPSIDVDVVMHFASPASPPDYQKYPLETLKAGAHGTFNTLETARESNARFILASTSEVYGDPKVHPQPENYWGNVNPTGPRSAYDEAKRFAEATTMAYHRKFKLDTRILRIFNTYGPLMRPDDGRVISNFITQALRGENLTVYGDGNQTRSFCYIDDLVEGIYKSMVREGLEGEIINLGNPEEYKIIELAKIVIKKFNEEIGITFKKLPEDDPRQRKPDITKAIKLLGWKPHTPLEVGIEKTIEYFRRIFP